MATVRDMLEAKKKREEAIKPDYWIHFQITYENNTIENVLGKDWDVAAEERYMYIWDVSRLGDGADRPPLRMINLDEVRSIETTHLERVKRVKRTKGGSKEEEEYLNVNVEFPCRTAKSTEDEVEIPPWEDQPEQSKDAEAEGGEEQVGADGVRESPEGVPEG